MTAKREARVSEPDVYLLGRSETEEFRLKRQIADLAPLSDAQLERVGIRAGERIVDLGCGPGGVLHLLGKRVGAAGSVLGIERSPHFVELARRFAADLGLPQIEVRQGDAYDTGLPRRSFDGAHMRLVLINVPNPELIVREMVALVKPGGWVASFEADYEGFLIDPPSEAHARLRSAYIENARRQGIDLFIGRRTHRMFREAGIADISVDVAVETHPPGHSRRPIFFDFINNVQEQIIGNGIMSRQELERDREAFARALADPTRLAVSNLYFRVIGRVPA
jgi:ubiquinone/menaquinone biosynthesis C-methylase UbiE